MYIKNSYKFFANKDCKFYPCHDLNEINCLFCYCPLYYRKNCGKWSGNLKDCSNCIFPHVPENYEHIIKILSDNKY